MNGTVQGGWPYVIAAYGVTWATWAAYAAWLWLRGRRERP
jgi:hypothetical protein